LIRPTLTRRKSNEFQSFPFEEFPLEAAFSGRKIPILFTVKSLQINFIVCAGIGGKLIAEFISSHEHFYSTVGKFISWEI
jgi:tRNA A22 N-methylase